MLSGRFYAYMILCARCLPLIIFKYHKEYYYCNKER